MSNTISNSPNTLSSSILIEDNNQTANTANNPNSPVTTEAASENNQNGNEANNKTSSAKQPELTSEQAIAKSLNLNIDYQRALILKQLPDRSIKGQLPQIANVSNEKNRAITISLPKANNGKPISVDQVTNSDYQQAFAREMFKQVGLSDVTNKEIESFLNNYRAVSGNSFGLNSSMNELREKTTNGQLNVYVSDYDLSLVTIGKQAILSTRQAIDQAGADAYKNGSKYVDQLMVGYIAAQVNAPINLANGYIEPTKALVSKLGIDIPKIPKWQAAQQSEYWRQGTRIDDAETGAKTALALTLGDAINSKLLQTRPGQALLGLDAMYNLGTAALAADPTEIDPKTGQYKPIDEIEVGLRIFSGITGGFGVYKSLDLPNIKTTGTGGDSSISAPELTPNAALPADSK